MTPEGKVKAEIKKILKEKGIFYFMPNMSGLGSTGMPDFLLCINGSWVTIEAKRDSKAKITPKQQVRMKQLRQAGALTLLVHADNMGDFQSYISELYIRRNGLQLDWKEAEFYFSILPFGPDEK